MESITFINSYKEAFGEAAELPVVFWYSDTPVAETERINGCFFKGFAAVKQGEAISLSIDTISCGGGKFYTGFTEMPERIPNFVSLKEKYKKTPEMVLDFINQLRVPLAMKKYLNISPMTKVDSFENVEGVLFFATPDILSGLTSWVYFDNNSDDAVTSKFASGCSAVITETVVENNRNGRRTFLGLFDPSVRPHVDASVLSFTIPMSRFKEMYHTMRDSCLFDTHAWGKVRARINGQS